MGSSIVTALTSTFTTLGTAIVQLIKSCFNNLFYEEYSTTSGTTLVISHLAEFGFVLLGVSLVIGITRWVMSLVRRKI